MKRIIYLFYNFNAKLIIKILTYGQNKHIITYDFANKVQNGGF